MQFHGCKLRPGLVLELHRSSFQKFVNVEHAIFIGCYSYNPYVSFVRIIKNHDNLYHGSCKKRIYNSVSALIVVWGGQHHVKKLCAFLNF